MFYEQRYCPGVHTCSCYLTYVDASEDVLTYANESVSIYS